MPTQIEMDAREVLSLLAAAPRDEFVPGPTVAAETGLPPDRVNDAVALLVDSGHAEWVQTMGTAPFDFHDVTITSRGRYEDQRLANVDAERVMNRAAGGARTEPSLPPVPIGSPFGFTDADWE